MAPVIIEPGGYASDFYLSTYNISICYVIDLFFITISCYDACYYSQIIQLFLPLRNNTYGLIRSIRGLKIDDAAASTTWR